MAVDPTTPQGLVGDPIAATPQVLPAGGGGVGSAGVVSSSVANNIDYVGDVNLTQMSNDIVNNPQDFLDDRGAVLSDRVPTIDANTAGTTIDNNNYNMDADALQIAAAQAGTAQAAGVTSPLTAQNYTAQTTFDQISQPANLADAKTMSTNPNAIVSADQIDQQGVATGVNADGSINQTGVALNQFAHQNISNIIDTTTANGKLLAQTLGEGNYTDAKATVQGQLAILQGEFTDANGNPKIPGWASGIAKQVSRNMAFSGVTGTAALEAMTSALMQATLPIAQADSKFFQTVTVKNLDNKQQMIVNKANVLSKFEATNLDVKTNVAVNNAKTFMQYDMTNLANEQKVSIVNAQAKQQSILEDAKQVNVQRRFGAESQMETDRFYDQLGTQIDQFNVTQKNTMEKFNTGELNDVFEFNATMENNREQFYQNMQYQIDSANAKWRQSVTLTNAEMDFQAAATDVKNTLSITTEQLNQMWDRTDSLLDYAWKEGQNREDRKLQMERIKAEMYAAQLNHHAKTSSNSGMMSAIGSIAGAVAGPAAGAAFGPAGMLSLTTPGAGAAVAAASDVRLKDDILPIGQTADGQTVYTWRWNDEAERIGVDNDPTIGLLAQEVEKRNPGAIVEGSDGYKRIKYDEVLP